METKPIKKEDLHKAKYNSIKRLALYLNFRHHPNLPHRDLANNLFDYIQILNKKG